MQKRLKEMPEKGYLMIDNNTLLTYMVLPGICLLATIHERVTVLWKCIGILNVYRDTEWFQGNNMEVV